MTFVILKTAVNHLDNGPKVPFTGSDRAEYLVK